MPTPEPMWRRYLRFWGTDVQRDVDDELAFHLEMRTRELERRGVDPAEAKEQAARRFGNLAEVRVECTELGRQRLQRHRRLYAWDAVRQDVRYGLRTLLARPGFSLLVVLTLSLGIGANTAVFSVAHAVLFAPLPYHEPEALVRLWSRNTPRDLPFFSVSGSDFVDWRAQNEVFTTMAAFERQRDVVLAGGSEPKWIVAARVGPEIFSLLGVGAPFGRTLVADDAKRGTLQPAVLSHEAWVTRFGTDSSVLGRSIVLDGEPSTIVGVMPERFTVPGSRAQIWTPLDLSPKLVDRGRRDLRVLGRLRPGVTVERARIALETVAARLAQRYPDTNRDWSINIVPVPEAVVGESFRESLFLLLGAVTLVLLIACANAANLLLARAATRRKEIAIRVALGAARWRILGQLLTESALLGAAAGAAGLGLAAAGVAGLKALGSADVPRVSEVRIDGLVLAFTAAVALLSGVLFGLAPASQLARAGPQESLNAAPRGSGPGAVGGRLRAALVVAEVMLSLVLLIGAGLLLRSFARLQRVELGFDSRQLVVAPLRLPATRYDTPQNVRAFYDAALQRVRGLPGVIEAAAVSSAPFAGRNSGLVFTPAGSPQTDRGTAPDADYRVIAPRYLETMKIPLLRGRALSDQDVPGVPPAALINQTMARRFWPGQNPIGLRLQVGEQAGDVTGGVPVTIVGVVGDARYQSLETPEPRPMVYLAIGQTRETELDLVLRSDAAPADLAAALREALGSLDPSLPVPNPISMDQILSDEFASRRFALVLFGVFAGIAVVLAAVGIYGVMSYLVRQRTQEIGVRVALGASRSALVGMVLVETLRLALVGVVAGLAGAWLLTRLLSGLLFGITPTDPTTFWGLAGLVVCLALVAGLVPAYRAARVDPMTALRAE